MSAARRRPAPTRRTPNARREQRTAHPDVPQGARAAALFVLQQMRDGVSWEQAWRRVDLPEASRDRRFAVDLAGGTLRLRARLDWFLEPLVNQGLTRLEDDVLDILRLGAFQVLEERVPDHAAVSATVELAKRVTPAASGLVNAVLRGLLRRTLRELPDAHSDPVAHLVVAQSHPEWIVRRWLSRFGFEATQELCRINNRRPTLRLRVNRRRTTRDRVLELLPGSVAGSWSPWSVSAATSRWEDIAALLRQGLVSVQDESGVVIGDLCGAQPGETWVDAAASPGGKTGCLAEALGGQGRILAFDVGPEKVARLQELPHRLGFDNIHIQQADAHHLPLRQVDGVLLDAPCSGLGVLGRRPDARWRKRPADLPRLAALQRELLDAVAHNVRPGGTLVYSLCSFEPEETVAVIRAFEEKHTDFVPRAADMPSALQSQPGVLYFLPQEHGLDGGFAARWTRRAG